MRARLPRASGFRARLAEEQDVLVGALGEGDELVSEEDGAATWERKKCKGGCCLRSAARREQMQKSRSLYHAPMPSLLPLEASGTQSKAAAWGLSFCTSLSHSCRLPRQFCSSLVSVAHLVIRLRDRLSETSARRRGSETPSSIIYTKTRSLFREKKIHRL